jgi:hypothetical protein
MSQHDTEYTLLLVIVLFVLILFMWALQACERQESRIKIYQTADGYSIQIVDAQDKQLICDKCTQGATLFITIDGASFKYCERHRPPDKYIPDIRD